jgi:polyketide synthase PksN
MQSTEEAFGALPKTVLFENLNINDLTHYFVNKHRAPRYEKLTDTYEALLPMAAAIIAFRKTGIIYG